MWVEKKYKDLPKEKRIPPIDNTYPRPDIPIMLYPVAKAKFQEDLDICKGYINELFYLSQ